MPFKLFKAFTSRKGRRGDPAAPLDYQEDSLEQRRQGGLLLRKPTRRKEPIFTPLPSRTPTEGEEYRDGYVEVEDPNTVMRGALNARPTTSEHLMLPLERDDRISLSHLEHDRPYRDHSRFPPENGYPGSFRGGMTERDAPDDPIHIHSRPRSGSSSSEHTIENLRTPTSPYLEPRVIPPLPHRSGSHMSVSKSPTDIYGGRRHDVHVTEVPTHHNPEIYRDRGPPVRSHRKDAPMYYIVPGGMNVVFQDHRGNEITRVGDFSATPQRYGRPAPFVVQDQRGREIYRYDGRDGPQHQPQVVRVETYPTRRERSYSTPTYHSDPSRRHRDPRDDYRRYPERREYGSYRGHRDYGGRGDPRRYGEEYRRDGEDYRRHGEDYRRHGEDYRRHGEDYRRHGEDFRRHGDHEGHRNLREDEDHRYRGEYQGHEYHTDHGPTDAYPPGPLQVPHRAHSHSSHASMSGPSRQLSPPHTDDRRSGISRVHEGSVHSIHDGGHLEVYDEISDGLDAVHMD